MAKGINLNTVRIKTNQRSWNLMFLFYMVICYINQQAEVTVSSRINWCISANWFCHKQQLKYILLYHKLNIYDTLVFSPNCNKKSMLVEQL